ncbi:MAG: hypothetical protein ACI8WB_000359 [Phenylobacterium sp.]|jgi:hypothetical protein
MMNERQTYDYCACYCEENIWHLCQHPNFAGFEKRIVVISNADKTCAVWHQSAASEDQVPVIWDYHVILLVLFDHWTVWDLDSTLPLGEAFTRYLPQTFPTLAPQYHRFMPRFKVIENQRFIRSFSSDRSHMRQADGSWFSPPPPWPAIINDRQLIHSDVITMTDDGADGSLSLDQLKQIFIPKQPT